MGSTAICFLVINKMKELPEIVIKSAFEASNEDIYVGYLRLDDLPALPKSERIKFFMLEPLGFDSDSEFEYQTFADKSFYQIVQYKWTLLVHVLSLDYDFVIYSDTDVYWNLDPIAEIESVFEILPKINVQIQSFTDSLISPRLCMGFVAFRKSKEVLEFINLCRERHTSMSKEHDKVGDDDVVTALYKELGRPDWLIELPQTTFPVGRMLKLYALNSIYPGLGSPTPFIFHANYVVGLKNKILLLKLFISKYSVNSGAMRMTRRSQIILLLKHLRLMTNKIKSRF